MNGEILVLSIYLWVPFWALFLGATLGSVLGATLGSVLGATLGSVLG
jgi:membrane protein YqaA with SNARE-associated domain